MQAEVQQGPRSALAIQLGPQFVGLGLQFLAHTDHRVGDAHGVVNDIAFNAPVVLQVVRLDEGRKQFGMGAKVTYHRLALDPFGGAFVDNIEGFAEADQSRSLAHDVVSQPMQRAHAIADAGQQPLFLAYEAADATAEVLDCAVGDGDDQHLALVERPLGSQPLHQARGQQAQREGLAAAGHGADAHGPVGIFKDCLLRRARGEFGFHRVIVAWIE